MMAGIVFLVFGRYLFRPVSTCVSAQFLFAAHLAQIFLSRPCTVGGDTTQTDEDDSSDGKANGNLAFLANLLCGVLPLPVLLVTAFKPIY